MMGERLVMRENLFYAFRLEDHVPSDEQRKISNAMRDLKPDPNRPYVLGLEGWLRANQLAPVPRWSASADVAVDAALHCTAP
jgi:hypothetical protein